MGPLETLNYGCLSFKTAIPLRGYLKVLLYGIFLQRTVVIADITKVRVVLRNQIAQLKLVLIKNLNT